MTETPKGPQNDRERDVWNYAWERGAATAIAQALILVGSQPLHHDTHSGVRQKWLRNEIILKLQTCMMTPLDPAQPVGYIGQQQLERLQEGFLVLIAAEARPLAEWTVPVFLEPPLTRRDAEMLARHLEFVEAAKKLLASLPAHWHGEAEVELQDLVDEEEKIGELRARLAEVRAKANEPIHLEMQPFPYQDPNVRAAFMAGWTTHADRTRSAEDLKLFEEMDWAQFEIMGPDRYLEQMRTFHLPDPIKEGEPPSRP